MYVRHDEKKEEGKKKPENSNDVSTPKGDAAQIHGDVCPFLTQGPEKKENHLTCDNVY